MLQYRRRNAATPAPVQVTGSVPALVGLCNWSYDRNRHIDSRMLRRILTSFSPEYIHLYLRIFNEASAPMLASFMEYENIDPSRIENIYRILQDRGYDLRRMDEIF